MLKKRGASIRNNKVDEVKEINKKIRDYLNQEEI